MPSQNFTINPTTNSGAGVQYSSALTVTGSQRVRVRFSRFRGLAEASLEIVANGVTTYVHIDDKEAWATSAVAAGDVIRLRVILKGDALSIVTGVLETF